MVDNSDDREDNLSLVKDTVIRMSGALKEVALVIGDPETTSTEDTERALRALREALTDSDSLDDCVDRLESVTEYDEVFG